MSAEGKIVFHSEYLSALLNSINASIVATDSHFIIKYWNQFAETVFGFPAEEVIGKRGNSILRFRYINDTEESARIKLIRNGLWQGRIIHTKHSGEEVVLNAVVSVVKNNRGEITGFVGVHYDITEYSKVKTDLTTLLSTLSNIDDDFIILDKEFRITFLDEKSSQSLEKYYGVKYCVGDLILDKVLPDRIQRVTESLETVLGGNKITYETSVKDVDGRVTWLQGNYFPIKENNGSVSHICIIIRDITSVKEFQLMRETLYRNRKLFETFMENSPILSWVVDREGMILYLNPAYLKMFHLQKQVMGQSLFEIFPSVIAQQFCENNAMVLESNQPIKTIESATTPDNKEHLYQVFKFPLVSDDQTYIGGWAIDITEEILLREHLNKSLHNLRQSEKELKEALEKEYHLNNLKSRFVSMASHEFRTPLSTMLSSTFLLEKYTTAEQQVYRTKHIGKLKESIQQMNDLLEDFLSVGKLDEGKTAIVASYFNLPHLINDVIEETEPLQREGQKIFFDADAVQKIQSDKKLLRSILINLLSNACKFSAENKNVWISLKKNNHQVKITVKDEGIGIDEEDMQHLFETFFRGTNAQSIQGTGLGLHIVKRYAELLNGSVQLESKINEGTTVTLLLPLDY